MAARQSLVARGHAAHGPGPEHAAAARREEPAIQRLGEDRHTGPTPKRSLNSSMYATFNAVPGRAWPRKKSRRRRQDLVRPTQLRDLGPQLPELRHRLLGRLPGLRRHGGVRLVAPTAQ